MRILNVFTNNLRLQDNPAFYHALDDGQVLNAYILDEATAWPIQGAASWWLHKSLERLSATLGKKKLTLILKRGDALEALPKLAVDLKVDAVYCARAYDPRGRELEDSWHAELNKRDIKLKRFAGSLLHEPENVETQQGNFFKVFTPFYKHASQKLKSRIPKSESLARATQIDCTFNSDDLNDWDLLPSKPNWAQNFDKHWTPGEHGAQQKLDLAIDSVIENYAKKRDLLADSGTSQLSPHLSFGEISPAQIIATVRARLDEQKAEAFIRQLYWREFNYHLLFHQPRISDHAFRDDFEKFPWKADKTSLKAWQKAQTGYPIVDAAMRQLWHTGWMHNRARLIVASFLTKHLLIDWREGAQWFWDTLVDADLANNSGGWQWTAGSGADAAPYFRIFNPILQAEKFDPKGDYIRRWLPELKKLPNKYLYAPWEAPKEVLNDAGIKLGEHYPEPIVDHKAARERALAAYDAVKK